MAPEELFSIAETDLWKLSQTVSHYRCRCSLEFQSFSTAETKPKRGQFTNFSHGYSETKVQCESCLFPIRKNTRILTKMGEIHELFVFTLSLVWFAGATPDTGAGFGLARSQFCNHFGCSGNYFFGAIPPEPLGDTLRFQNHLVSA